MTEEIAKKIIKRKEGMMTAALILMGVGCLMFLLGMLNIIFLEIGGILFLTGTCVGIIARENKKYKAANEYMEKKIREEKINSRTNSRKKVTIKCSECFRPIDGYVWHLNNKAYCQECYNRNMTIIRQTAKGEDEVCDTETTSKGVIPKSKYEPPKKSKTFVCNICGKSLPIKYLHLGNTCVECYQLTKDNRKAGMPLGSFDFTEDDREKLKSVAMRYMPSTLATVEAQLSLLRTLSFVMEISAVELKTEFLWKIPDEMPDEDKEKRLKSAFIETIFAVDQTISFQNPNFLMKKVNSAGAEDLLKSWIVLDYYAHALKPKYTPNIQYFRDYIHNVIQTKFANPSNTNAVSPIKVDGTNIYFDSNAFFQWKEANVLEPRYELKEAILLTAKTPTIYLYEDGVKTREYVLQTEGDEDFSGKYFLILIRIGMLGNPSAPVAQIDGFISDTPEERKMTRDDIGYRFEDHYLKCGGEISKQYYEKQRGQDLEAKGLKYPGYTTPSNVRLIGICPECGKSFAFHGYAFYMGQCDVAYSDDGLDCCEIQTYNIDKATWSFKIDGKTFRYYNSFNCPHCGTPYIDYKKYPANKVFGVSGCVLLGRKALTVIGEPLKTIDDITFIKDVRRFDLKAWQKYDILLAAQGYGWEDMIEWADYMTEADLKNISEVTVDEENITESYRSNGGKCSQTPELNTECRNLSVAGISDVLRVPMKIVWYNQTRMLRFFTLINDEMLIKKYAETVVRRNFGTADAMKPGKSIPQDN